MQGEIMEKIINKAIRDNVLEFQEFLPKYMDSDELSQFHDICHGDEMRAFIRIILIKLECENILYNFDEDIDNPNIGYICRWDCECVRVRGPQMDCFYPCFKHEEWFTSILLEVDFEEINARKKEREKRKEKAQMLRDITAFDNLPIKSWKAIFPEKNIKDIGNFWESTIKKTLVYEKGTTKKYNVELYDLLLTSVLLELGIDSLVQRHDGYVVCYTDCKEVRIMEEMPSIIITAKRYDSDNIHISIRYLKAEEVKKREEAKVDREMIFSDADKNNIYVNWSSELVWTGKNGKSCNEMQELNTEHDNDTDDQYQEKEYFYFWDCLCEIASVWQIPEGKKREEEIKELHKKWKARSSREKNKEKIMTEKTTLKIYEGYIPCPDCEANNSSHNELHIPYTEMFFTVGGTPTKEMKEYYNKVVEVESWTEEEVQEEMRRTGLSLTQVAIQRIKFLSS